MVMRLKMKECKEWVGNTTPESIRQHKRNYKGVI